MMTAAAKKSGSKPAVQPQPVAQPAAEQAKPEPAPAPVAATQTVTPSKQDAVLAQLREAWAARGVDLSHLETRTEGKTLIVKVGEAWPLVHIGFAGGLEIPEIRSYQKAMDAAVIGDELLKKQTERDAKRTNGTTAPAPKPIEVQIAEVEKLIADATAKLNKLREQQKATATAEAPKAETPAAKKQKQHADLEAKMA